MLMPRKSRENSGTGIYHVMLRGINRQNIFYDIDDYECFLDLLRRQINPIDDNKCNKRTVPLLHVGW